MIPLSETVRSTGPGRPRDPGVNEKILKAALRQLAHDGYARMSMDAVASEAGVTKPTVYRRWSSKADLATAALAELQEDGPTPSTGSASSDLRTVLTTLQETLYQTNGMAIIGAVLVEQSHTPDLITFFRKRIVRPRRMKLRQVLEEAEKRGELRPKADIDAAVNMLIGSFYAYYLTSEKMPQAWARRIVDTVWKGIAKTPQRRRITRH
ncbi:MAG: TetR family transcriptional regulator [Acidobacteria bacterium]|nr:TetR family transcriptional regulator [Acidobacteriota bacterium]MBF85977.1 TetR family transcriptional regulator [Acidobacteriota bacterium]MCH2278649.1 TetR/AcrR family transcriptional regulator [Vicinamibacterales bacterium]